MSICVGVRDTSRRSYRVCIFTCGIPMCRLSRFSNSFNTLSSSIFTSMVQHDSVTQQHVERQGSQSHLRSNPAEDWHLRPNLVPRRLLGCVWLFLWQCSAIVLALVLMMYVDGIRIIETQKQIIVLESSFSCHILLPTLCGLPSSRHS